MQRNTCLFTILALTFAAAATADDDTKKKPKQPFLLKAQRGEAVFNGKDLSNWTAFSVDEGTKMEDVWSVKDGLLVCKGTPNGYLASKEKYANFRLLVEWRWAPSGKPGNSGVLMRLSGPLDMMLPKCVEAQLKHESAGDMYGFQGFKIDGKDKFEIPDHKLGGHLSGLKKTASSENEPGEWNKYIITMNDGTATLVVNGTEVNSATGCDVVAGPIALQSEGGEIHFRTVRIFPIKKR